MDNDNTFPWLEGLNPDQRGRRWKARKKRLLVTAGAGSGKTFVIVRRIAHLIRGRGISPERILAITFTRNAAREMLDRVNAELGDRFDTKPEIKTFHALCYKILRQNSKKVSEQGFTLAVDSSPSEDSSPQELDGRPLRSKSDVVTQALERCLEDRTFRRRFRGYLLRYHAEAAESDSGAGLSDNRETRFMTAAGVEVRSMAEREIANFFHERRVTFEYSKTVECAGKTIQADFYLPGQDTYLEVWEDSPGSKGRLRKAKQAFYTGNNLKLIQVRSAEILEPEALAARLELQLNLETKADDRSGQSYFARLNNESTGLPQALKSFLSAFEETLDKMRNRGVEAGVMKQRLESLKSPRASEFYELFFSLFEKYIEVKDQAGVLDFNDLIETTIKLLRTDIHLRERYRDRWSQVLVDEYQDVNDPQVRFLKEIVGERSTLVCVGDDWQSIYGFRGSNVAHIQDFEKEFRGAANVNLRVNYRSGKSIVEYSNYIIRRSRKYREKEVYALNASVSPVRYQKVSRLNRDGLGFVVSEVRKLVDFGHVLPDDILILYRRASAFRNLGLSLQSAGLKVRHETIHGAKGLEAKVVFIWGLVGGKGGFPSIWDSGEIMRVVEPYDVDRRMDEERRVFHVATTRARELLYLISEKNNLSEFLKNNPARFFDFRALDKHIKDIGNDNCAVCGSMLKDDYLFCPYCYNGLKIKK